MVVQRKNIFTYKLPKNQIKKKLIEFAEKRGYFQFKPLISWIKSDLTLKTKFPFNLFILVNLLPGKSKNHTRVEYLFLCKGWSALDIFGAGKKGETDIKWIHKNLKVYERQMIKK